jgi:hypothetical protein
MLSLATMTPFCRAFSSSDAGGKPISKHASIHLRTTHDEAHPKQQGGACVCVFVIVC